MRDALGAAAGLVFGWSLVAIGHFAQATTLALACATPPLVHTDLKERRLPATLTLPTLGFVLGADLAAGPTTTPGLLRALALTLALAAILVVSHVRRWPTVGGGDLVLVAIVACAFADPAYSVLSPLVALMVSPIIALAIGRRNRREQPLGAGILLAATAIAAIQLVRRGTF